MNLRWSWHGPTQELFAEVDPKRWAELDHDPIRLLGAVPAQRFAQLAQDGKFLGRLSDAVNELDQYLSADRWYQSLESDRPRQIAYFSPEFGISKVMPQYSGGLGILAGDHLKSASDLGVPLIGVGLLYRHGYFRQSLSPDGWQLETYPVVDPHALPLGLLREPDGTPVLVGLALPGDRVLRAHIWVAHVGRVPLLLLDSNIEDNAPPEREVTDRLYGGGTEHRLLQEMLLGIGGVRALRAYARITGAAEPEVFHTNEGHAGFLGLERIREYTDESGLDFDAARAITRAGTVFTTHTPVPAGIDRFGRDLIAQYLGGLGKELTAERILALGAEDYPGGDPGVFNMAVMGLRLAQRANGVSRLHGEVSRAMFSGLWPGFDENEVPITSVTNGVHAESWVAPQMQRLHLQSGLDQVSDAELWQARREMREALVADARHRLRRSASERGSAAAELKWIDDALDPSILTIGFARRVPSYKRLTLMLEDPDRLRSLLLHETRPIQIVIAGKAHPADDGGKKFIQQIVRFADDPAVRHRIVFLPDYDMGLAEPMVAGCDVWLNNPLRPYEACGTSGMKAALNGGLNVSIRDGWWDEWYDGVNGWPIPSAEGVSDQERRDALEASALYDLLEYQVAPRFYDVGEDGVPSRWLEMVRHTLGSLGPKVVATRMLTDYVTELYAPSAASSGALNASFEGARSFASWTRRVRDAWPGVRVDHVETVGEVGGPNSGEVPQLGTLVPLRVFVSLGELSPEDVDVQVLYGSVEESDTLSAPAVASLRAAEGYEAGRWRYEGSLPLSVTGSFGYTVRVLPRNPALASDAELGLVSWPT